MAPARQAGSEPPSHRQQRRCCSSRESPHPRISRENEPFNHQERSSLPPERSSHDPRSPRAVSREEPRGAGPPRIPGELDIRREMAVIAIPARRRGGSRPRLQASCTLSPRMPRPRSSKDQHTCGSSGIPTGLLPVRSERLPAGPATGSDRGGESLGAASRNR